MAQVFFYIDFGLWNIGNINDLATFMRFWFFHTILTKENNQNNSPESFNAELAKVYCMYIRVYHNMNLKLSLCSTSRKQSYLHSEVKTIVDFELAQSPGIFTT